MKKPDYWDITIFIPPAMVKLLRADCGDSYDPRSRCDSGHQSVCELLSLMDDYEDKGPIGAWGSNKAKGMMAMAMNDGLTIAINKRGELRAFLGDALRETHKWNEGTEGEQGATG